MDALLVVYHPAHDRWYAVETRVAGPAAGRYEITGWARDLDHAARLSPAAAALVATVHGGVALTLTEAWRRTEPTC